MNWLIAQGNPAPKDNDRRCSQSKHEHTAYDLPRRTTVIAILSILNYISNCVQQQTNIRQAEQRHEQDIQQRYGYD